MRGFTSFQITVVVLLAAIALGIAYLVLREQPRSRAFREADRMLAMQEAHEDHIADARQVAAKTDASNLFQALRLYKLDHGRYPSQEEGLEALLAAPKPSLDKLPIDPWGRPYQYANPGKRAEVEVFSAGPDGLNRTADDIGSWKP
ncbi:MAG: Type II secretion system protein G [Paracidovorax wautersii]|uniref:Type II secretion system protein G n=1 Tax=Paracidovorax wautersii TaxID=1177982 RepID=A0A7V8FLU0_9BURK|nr:MAG: Type II secretion system protein G [Paracidovorax wautersii]